VTADLVIDCTTGTWSNSCSEPAPQRASGARPPITTTGEPLNHMLVIADTPLVMPGPAVSAAKPGLRVSLAHASAAKAAVCSWRVSTTRMPWSRAASYSGQMCPPLSVNITSVPNCIIAATACCPACPSITLEVPMGEASRAGPVRPAAAGPGRTVRSGRGVGVPP
jgi:hypothetical protein